MASRSQQLSKQYDGLFEHGGPLKNLVNPRTSESLSFPGELGQLDHWVAFTVIKHSRARADVKQIKNVKQTIFLPIPHNLGTTYSAGYESEGLGAIGAAGAALGENVGVADWSNPGGVVGRVVDQLKSVNGRDLVGGLTNLAMEGSSAHISAAAALIAGGAGAAVATAASEQLLKGALFGAGIARNPHMAVLFSGIDFRTHNFQYKLIAKTRAESAMAQKIIYAFKYYMAPEYALVDHLFKYPEQFEIDFHHAKNLFNISSSVLKSFEVNYHGEGIPAYHHDGETSTSSADPTDIEREVVQTEQEISPVSITLNMTFQETSIVTKTEIERDNR